MGILFFETYFSASCHPISMVVCFFVELSDIDIWRT
ncbi:hypothetical protein RGQ29_021173 [Quercus rubra]|uniref:Uncharacterized protein n=1 Tax=Quercus rubra TaxID=3512 RepID=A0AAN7IVF2_QUERU|nr:hypothetical protein RGQ29_021173 [Quercus rubra]